MKIYTFLLVAFFSFNLSAASFLVGDCNNSLVKIITTANNEKISERADFKKELLKIVYAMRDIEHSDLENSEISVAVNYLLKSPFVESTYQYNHNVINRIYFFKMFVRDVFRKFNHQRRGHSYFSQDDWDLLDDVINSSEWSGGLEGKSNWPGMPQPLDQRKIILSGYAQQFQNMKPKKIITQSAYPKFPDHKQFHYRTDRVENDMAPASMEWTDFSNLKASSDIEFQYAVYNILTTAETVTAEDFLQDFYNLTSKINMSCTFNWSFSCQEVMTYSVLALLNTKYAVDEWFWNNSKFQQHLLNDKQLHEELTKELGTIFKELIQARGVLTAHAQDYTILDMLDVIFNQIDKKIPNTIILLKP